MNFYQKNNDYTTKLNSNRKNLPLKNKNQLLSLKICKTSFKFARNRTMTIQFQIYKIKFLPYKKTLKNIHKNIILLIPFYKWKGKNKVKCISRRIYKILKKCCKVQKLTILMKILTSCRGLKANVSIQWMRVRSYIKKRKC